MICAKKSTRSARYKVTAIYPDAGWVAVSTGFRHGRMFFQGYTKAEVIYKLRHEYNMIVPNNVSSRKPSLAEIFPLLGIKWPTRDGGDK